MRVLSRKFQVESLQHPVFDVRQTKPVEFSRHWSRTRSGSADGCGAVHLCIIERGESGDHGDAESFLAANEIARKNAPGASSVANPPHSGEAVDSYGELGAVFEDFADERFRQLDAAGTTIVAVRAVRNVGPAFEEDAAARTTW